MSVNLAAFATRYVKAGLNVWSEKQESAGVLKLWAPFLRACE